MPKENIQKQRNISRNCNVNVLTDIGYKRIMTSNIFKKDDFIFFSPGISKGIHEKYWFDVRMENIKKIIHTSKTQFLLRVVPAHFGLFKWQQIEGFLTESNSAVRNNSGVVWGFYCEIDENKKEISVFSKNNLGISFTTKLLSESEAREKIALAV